MPAVADHDAVPKLVWAMVLRVEETLHQNHGDCQIR